MEIGFARRGCLAAATLWVLALASPAALAEQGPAVSALNPSRPAPDGWLAPTLDGDWRFRIAVDGWMPNSLDIAAMGAGGGGGTIHEDLIWILKGLRYYVPVDFEARKGTFGFLFHNLYMGLGGDVKVLGPVTLDWDVDLLMWDVGLTYEVGRWQLWEASNAPELTIEPYFEARIIYLPIDITVGGFASGNDLNSQVPVVGTSAFIDLTEHWNLQFIGDYGGWGVDDNHATWQGAAYLGYRWPGWGAHWNLQVGYRAMQLFDIKRSGTSVSMAGRGANVTLAVEF